MVTKRNILNTKDIEIDYDGNINFTGTNEAMDLNTKLDFYVRNNLNVLFTGPHGTGKTAMIVETMKRNNIENYVYFSASTLDPWVDFIGVPKEKTEGDLSYLELVKPKKFAEDKVEVIILDELNRAHKKIKNAVMELIQFKSINGQRLNNLKFIWAAINPEDEDNTYDVEKLDPALLDRFHVQMEVSKKPSKEYFINKYGNDNALAAIDWWNSIFASLNQKEKDNNKIYISPRRLDYALEMWKMGGDLADTLPSWSNPLALKTMLIESNIEDQILKIRNLSNEKIKTNALKRLMNNPSNMERTVSFLLDNDSILLELINLIEFETLTKIHNDRNYSEKFNKFLDAYSSRIETVVERLRRVDIGFKDEEVFIKALQDKYVISDESLEKNRGNIKSLFLKTRENFNRTLKEEKIKIFLENFPTSKPDSLLFNKCLAHAEFYNINIDKRLEELKKSILFVNNDQIRDKDYMLWIPKKWATNPAPSFAPKWKIKSI